MVTNILDTSESGYLGNGNALRAYLEEKYPTASSIQLRHENDRWKFELPEALSSDQLKQIAQEVKKIVRRSNRTQAQEGGASAE